MNPKDRQRLGKSGKLPEEINLKQEAKNERELQNQIESLCRILNLYCERSRMDRRTTGSVGKFDFDIVLPTGRHWAVEAKTIAGKLSDAQVSFFADYKAKTGRDVAVVRSLTEFRAKLALEHLDEA